MKNHKVIAIIDWENIRQSMMEESYSPEGYSILSGLEKMKNWLLTIGQQIWIIVYVCSDQLFYFIKTFEQLEFTSIICQPEEEEGQKKDTTDRHIISDFSKLLDMVSDKGIYCLCLGSGDADFMPILKKAKEKGIKIAIAAGSKRSISQDLKKMADNHPEEGNKMIHIITPLITPKDSPQLISSN